MMARGTMISKLATGMSKWYVEEVMLLPCSGQYELVPVLIAFDLDNFAGLTLSPTNGNVNTVLLRVVLKEGRPLYINAVPEERQKLENVATNILNRVSRD